MLQAALALLQFGTHLAHQLGIVSELLQQLVNACRAGVLSELLDELVLQEPIGLLVRFRIGLVQVVDIGAMVGHLILLLIDIVHAVVGVLVAVCGQSATIPCHRCGITLIRIVHSQLILVRMTIEDGRDSIMEACYATIVLPGPDSPAGAIARGDVREHMHLFSSSFGGQQSVVEPLQLWDLVTSVVVQPEVVRVTTVAVQCNDTEALLGRHSVVTAFQDGLLRLGRQPLGPVVIQMLIQPLGIDLIRYFFGTETKGKSWKKVG